MRKHRGELLLLLAALIWGSSYIFQKMGMDYVGPFAFGFFRFCIGALALLPVIAVADRRKRGRTARQPMAPEPAAREQKTREPAARGSKTSTADGVMRSGVREELAGGSAWTDRTLIVGSVLCGLTQFGAGSLQQFGLVYTTAGKAGFITSMHIVIVPLMMIFLRRRVGFTTWIGVALAVFGLYLLCITEGLRLQLGDGLVLGCAVIYALQILLIDYYAVRTDPLRLASLQFLLAGVLSGLCMMGFERISWAMVIACAVPILYTGFLEVAAAYTLEILGQRTTPPAVTAIILSLESVFAVICGALVLGERMTGRETMGCVLMLAAFLFTQLAGLRRKET